MGYGWQKQTHFRGSLLPLAAWTVFISLLAGLTIFMRHQDALHEAENEARDYFKLNMAYRVWASQAGGLYARADRVAPNPHLKVQRRDVTTTDGQELTLINPAYMTRMVFDTLRAADPNPVINKITSLKPLNPGNGPDPWERESLIQFDEGSASERSQITEINGKPYLRFISSFVTEKSCLSCHAQQGYRLGDVRGAITISIPMYAYYQSESKARQGLLGGYLLLWMVGSGGIAASARRRYDYEAELRAGEQKFRTVCDFTQDWEYWVDQHGMISYISPSCLEVTGYPAGDFMDDPGLLLRLVHPEDSAAFKEHQALVAGGSPPASIEFRIVTSDGTIRWIHHNCRPVFSNSEFLGRRVSNRDMTELKSAEEKRHRSEQQMLHVQKLESLGVLAGGIAHDFNNILLAIMGNTSLALQRVSPGSPVELHLQQVEKASEKAADLARQMLAYSGKGRFVLEALDLNRLVREMTSMLEVSLSKKAALRFHLADQLPGIIADPTQIRQIIMNLAINASEAIGESSGVISIATGSRDCDCSYLAESWLSEELPEAQYVFLEITDTGCGMTKETVARIFEPFFTTKFTGRGLGMAAILGIVRGHKGVIKVYSEPGKGSSFKILFPASGRPVEKSSARDTDDGWRGEGTVLLVDDEETVRDVAGAMLRELGFEVKSAADGREALEQYRLHGNSIKLVLMDLNMPNLNGEEAFHELRSMDPKVRVILSSGFSEQEVTRKFLGKGLEGFVQKPYTLTTLRNIVSQL